MANCPDRMKDFARWMAMADRQCRRDYGVGIDDLPDQPWADWFEDCLSPSEAVEMADFD